VREERAMASNDEAEIAIALKYDKQADGAPRVVAKGLRLKAEKIREIAKQYGIPVMRNVSLANALYRVEVGQEVPEELYDAVAEVLNFIYALQKEQAGGR
jgi:flagellar biosynthesis protein